MTDETALPDGASGTGETHQEPAAHVGPLTPIGDIVGPPEPFEREGDTRHSADKAEVLDELFYEGDRFRPFLWRFGSLVVLSTSIAAFGLLANSVAVVIGAMLVAPLMTPILATSAAMVHGWVVRLLRSLAIVLGGILGAIATGWAVTALTAGRFTVVDVFPDEITSRTAPGLLDLCIAVAAGAAGGYVLSRREATSALPGVGIAVALIPPLATVGITLRLGSTDDAGGALLLFATNLAAIVLSAAVVLVVTGFVAPEERRQVRGRVWLGFVLALLIVLAIAVPLGWHTTSVIANQRFASGVRAAVEAWDPSVRIVDLTTSSAPGEGTVDLVVAGPNGPVPAWRLARLIRQSEGKPVTVSVSFQLEEADAATAR